MHSVRLGLQEPAGKTLKSDVLFLVEDFCVGLSLSRAATWGEAPSSMEGVLGLQAHFREWSARKGRRNRGFCLASLLVLSPLQQTR